MTANLSATRPLNLDRIRTAATSFLLADGGKGWIGARTGDYMGASSSLEVFEGDIPEHAYRSGLFGYGVESVPMQATFSGGVVTDSTRSVQVRDDLGMILGTGRAGKAVHDSLAWSVDLIGKADAGIRPVVIGSTGFGARAFVQFSGGTVLSASGVTVLPTLTFATSVDGSLPTGYAEGGSLLVCNNQTTGAGWARILGNIGATSRLVIRHTKHSAKRQAEVLPTFGLYESVASRMVDSIDALADITVTDKMLAAFLDGYAPVAKGEGAAVTRSENKRDAWNALYRNDPRCAPWTGTAFGVLQTANTFAQHVAEIRGENADRVTRQADAMLTGGIDKADDKAATILAGVLANA